MEIMESKTMKTAALTVRKKISKTDDVELIDAIKEAANKGEFDVNFVHTSHDDYPTISGETIKMLKKKGYKVKCWYRKGWDTLRRFYKGALSVSWYR